MSLRSRFLAGAALCATTILAGHAQAAIFSFDASAGASNPFSVTAGGNTATFTSASGPGTFAVANSGFFSFGTGLGDYGSFSGDPLTISFATPVTQSILIPFGVEDLFGTGVDTLTATANNGQVVTATTAFSGTGAPEGSLYITPTSGITSLTLTSANPYAIADVQVPEPMSLSLLGVGLAGVAALRRKKQAG